MFKPVAVLIAAFLASASAAPAAVIGFTGQTINEGPPPAPGGSGRFAGATGSFTGEGTIQIRPGQNALGIANLSGSINLVPEPAALGLLGAGAGLLALRGRKSARLTTAQR